MFRFIPPQEKVIISQYYLNTIEWYLNYYKESELLGWISHDDSNYFTITSSSHVSVTPLIFLNRESITKICNKMTCESEWYNINFLAKNRSLFNKSVKFEKLQNIELLKLWEDQPYLIYMIGNDDGDRAKSFKSKEEAMTWIRDVLQSGVCDSYRDFEILEDALLYN